MILLSILSPATAEIATGNSLLGDCLIGHCCQECLPRLTTGEVEAPAMDPAVNEQFHSNHVGAFIRYPHYIEDLTFTFRI